MDENRVKVNIFGESYLLKGDMHIKHVKKLAEIVDGQMQRIAQGNHRLPPEKIAVLAALHIVDEYLKLEEDYKELLKILKEEIDS